LWMGLLILCLCRFWSTRGLGLGSLPPCSLRYVANSNKPQCPTEQKSFYHHFPWYITGPNSVGSAQQRQPPLRMSAQSA
jgi:hypothetical protein